MNRRQLVAAGISSLVTVLSGCSRPDTQEQSDNQDLSVPDEPPTWADGGTIDLDTIRTNTVKEMVNGSLVFESRALIREQTTLPVAGNVLEENVTRVRANGNEETGLYQFARERGGKIDGGPRAASSIEELYYADEETYYYSNGGDYPSYGIDEGPFETFVDRVNEAIDLLFELDARIAFEDPLWDETNGVFVVQGTEIEGSNMSSDVELDTCEMHVNKDGVFLRGEVEMSVNDKQDVKIESAVKFPNKVDISEPDWVPEDIGQLTIEVAVEDGSWQFVYGQGEASSEELLLPANHIVELRTTGEYEYHQSFNMPDLTVKIDLVPDEEGSIEIYIPEELVGNSFEIYASELSPNYPMETNAEILEEAEFNEWVESGQ